MPATSSKFPPRLGGGLPFLGHAIRLNRDPVGLLRGARERFGEQCRFHLAGKEVTLLTGPRANEAFFRAPDSQLSAREAYQFTVPIFGKGIAYDTTPEVMGEQLAFLFPALRDERLQAYARFMQDEANAYFDRWVDQGEVCLLDVANEITTFIASRCLIGEEFRNSLSGEFADLYKDLEGGINLLAFFKPGWPSPAHWKRDRARVRMAELIGGIIADRRARGVAGEDFLETLMTARYKDGSQLSDDNITGMLITLIFAGQHTSAVLAAWTGILLLRDQHSRRWLGPIVDEQARVFGERGEGEMTLDRLRHLPLLERAINEAERMHPPLIMLMRTILTDFEYQGYVSPAGGLAMVSPAVSHRLPDVFTDPDRYDPDRFAPGREEHKKANYTLIGFGGGKHRCIGTTFAYQQVKAIWSVLLQRFDLELVTSEHAPDYKTFVVGPRRPSLLRYRRRARAAISIPGTAEAQDRAAIVN